MLLFISLLFSVLFDLEPRICNTRFVLQVQEIKTKTWNQGLSLKRFAVCEVVYAAVGCCCFFWSTQYSWLGVKYQLTDCLFKFSERKLNQTRAGFSDHCVNGTTCDPDTNICTATAKPGFGKCCLYAIPGMLSIPFLRLCPTLSRSPFASFCLYLFTCPYLFCHFVQLLQRLPSLSIHLFPETLSGVPRMQKSRSPVLRTQRYLRCILLSLT